MRELILVVIGVALLAIGTWWGAGKNPKTDNPLADSLRTEISKKDSRIAELENYITIHCPADTAGADWIYP